MYKFIAKAHQCSPVIKVKNQEVLRAVDAVQDDFVINKYGHIRSDFAVLTETTSQLDFARALSQMQSMFQESSSQFDGMTFEEMVSVLRPRWCQLPGEVDRFEVYLIDHALEFYKSLRKSELDTLEEEGVDVTGVKPATINGSKPAESTTAQVSE